MFHFFTQSHSVEGRNRANQDARESGFNGVPPVVASR
jgi:hypothetical protein